MLTSTLLNFILTRQRRIGDSSLWHYHMILISVRVWYSICFNKSYASSSNATLTELQTKICTRELKRLTDNKNKNAIPRRKVFVKGQQLLRIYKATTTSTILWKRSPGFYEWSKKESCSQTLHLERHAGNKTPTISTKKKSTQLSNSLSSLFF